MKIEKLSDYEIRCTLTQEDLASRHLKLGELAYGTEKTKKLFRDMMQQASFQYGFEAENTPLMVEAVPIGTGCIVVSITKVQDPDELDTRFSKFAPSLGTNSSDSDSSEYDEDQTDDFLPVSEDDDEDESEDDDSEDSNDSDGSGFTEIESGTVPAKADNIASEDHSKGSLRSSNDKDNARESENAARHMPLQHLFHTGSLHDIIELAYVIPSESGIVSTLYKNKNTSEYLLLVKQGSLAPSGFNRICIEIAEYLSPLRIPSAKIPLIEESSEVLIRNNVFADLRI